MKLSVIIVTWNSAHDIRNCLNSLVKELKNINSEIIVVDNNSQDNTAAIIEKHHSETIIIKNKGNRGFGAANNQGIKVAKGAYILLLNPDTVVHTNAIKNMLQFLEKEESVGMVGPEQLNGDGKPNIDISHATPRGIAECSIESLAPKSNIASQLKTPYEVKYLNGGCWLARKEIFEQAGLFDEKLFLYKEEADMCQRIRKVGWKIFFLRNATITHFREGSIKQIGKKKYLYWAKSSLRMFKKRIINFT